MAKSNLDKKRREFQREYLSIPGHWFSVNHDARYVTHWDNHPGEFECADNERNLIFTTTDIELALDFLESGEIGDDIKLMPIGFCYP